VIEPILDRLTRLHPRAVDLSLDRMVELLAALGDPQRHLPPVVHVAGTNGKGSTVAFLRALAEAAGLTVHAYTSPHLVRFAERIRIAGRLPDDPVLTALLEEVEAVNDGRPISFFEITTAAALLAFARTPADLCLLETGMGGRLDATNVVEAPALTLLTPIGLDHQAFLGPDLASIAAEKAGILKHGVPALTAVQAPAALAVIEARAAAVGAPLLVTGRDFQVGPGAGGGLRYEGPGGGLDLPQLPLPGRFQWGNAALALAAAARLGAFPLDPAGLNGAVWPARLQRLTRGPLPALLPSDWELWLDGAHNPHAATALAGQLAEWNDRPLGMVIGLLAAKEAGSVLAPLVPHLCALRTVSFASEQLHLTAASAAPAEAVAAVARQVGGRDVAAAADLVSAVTDLRRVLSGPARIVIAGSLYLAGTILADNG